MIEIQINEKDIFNIKNYLPTPPEMNELLKKLAEYFIKRFIEKIESQENWDGSVITKNSKRWREHKERIGADLRSLVYKDYDFLNSRNWDVNVNGDTLTVGMKNRLKDKFYDVKKIGKDYEFVMPNPVLKSNTDWFEDTLAELIENKILAKMKK
jgi:hypothetical protein